jgi:hypothetical protein
MPSIPKIRLRTIFLLFVCAAVGLATNFSLTAGLNAAVATAMVIGLLQQINYLRSATLVAASNDANIRFVIWFSIVWRAAIAGLMAICSVAQLLVAHGFLEIPVNTELLMLDGVWWIEVILQICITVVLSSSIRHFRSSEHAKPFTQWRPTIAWILSGILILAILPGRTQITYLVHVATAGIEAYQPLALRRPATFPDHYSQHFRLFWLSLGACVSLMIAGMSLVQINHRANQQMSTICAWVGFCVSLLIVAGFCGYYFGVEYSLVSPDLASVNLIADGFDWFSATLLTLILVTVGAYRLTQLASTATIVIQYRGDRVEPVLHESTGGLVLIAAMAFVPLALIAWSFFQSSAPIPWEELLGYILRNPNFYLAASVTLLSLHFLAIRWRTRNQFIAWQLANVHVGRFICNWFAVSALTLVGIPTLSAYSFVYWLGPWYLWDS